MHEGEEVDDNFDTVLDSNSNEPVNLKQSEDTIEKVEIKVPTKNCLESI